MAVYPDATRTYPDGDAQDDYDLEFAIAPATDQRSLGCMAAGQCLSKANRHWYDGNGNVRLQNRLFPDSIGQQFEKYCENLWTSACDSRDSCLKEYRKQESSNKKARYETILLHAIKASNEIQ